MRATVTDRTATVTVKFPVEYFLYAIVAGLVALHMTGHLSMSATIALSIAVLVVGSLTGLFILMLIAGHAAVNLFHMGTSRYSSRSLHAAQAARQRRLSASVR